VTPSLHLKKAALLTIDLHLKKGRTMGVVGRCRLTNGRQTVGRGWIRATIFLEPDKGARCGGEEKRPPFFGAYVGDSVGEEKRVYSVFAVNP